MPNNGSRRAAKILSKKSKFYLLLNAMLRMKSSAEGGKGKIKCYLHWCCSHWRACRRPEERYCDNRICIAAEYPQTHLSRIDTNEPRGYESRGIFRAKSSKWPLRTIPYDPPFNYVVLPDVQIGGMTAICQFCRAKRKCLGVTSEQCCSNVMVQLPPLRNPPLPLYSIFTGLTMESKKFPDNTRRYISKFQMTFVGANMIRNGGIMPIFKVQGQVYNSIEYLQPVENNEAQFLQIYFGDNHDHS